MAETPISDCSQGIESSSAMPTTPKVGKAIRSLKRASGASEDEEDSWSEEVIETLYDENAALKEQNTKLEEQNAELQNRLEKLADHYQSTVSPHDFKIMLEKLAMSSPKALELESITMTRKISQMELHMSGIAIQMRLKDAKLKRREMRISILARNAKRLRSRLSGLVHRVQTLSNACEGLRPTVLMVTNRSAVLSKTIKTLLCQLESAQDKSHSYRMDLMRMTLRSMKAQAGRRAALAESVRCQAAMYRQFKEIRRLNRQRQQLMECVETLEGRLSEATGIIHEQSEALADFRSREATTSH